MWKKLTTSQLQSHQDAVKARLAKDTGLKKISPKSRRGGKVVTPARLDAIMEDLCKYYELWLAYPDKLVALLLPEDTNFKLFPYQVLTLRSNLRYVMAFQAATRGFSKSFIGVLGKYLQCMLLPRSKRSLVAKEKKQAVQIGREKIDELQQLMPLLREEVDYRKGKGTIYSNDFIRLAFKNKSQFDIVPVSEGTRGGRRHDISFEEIKDLPAQPINAVILPLLNIARRTATGIKNNNEPHHQQLYVGSTGYVGTFAHDKAIEVMLESVFHPEKAFCWGASYKIPLYYGLLSEDFVNQIKNSSTYDDDDFEREFLSKWSTNVKGSLFDADKLRSLRKLKRAEWKARPEPNVFYMASVDVGRTSDRTIIEIFKVRRGDQFYTKSMVNIVVMEGRNFLYQANAIKLLDLDFDFDWVAIDANGLGVGLVDFLMSDTVDSSGRTLSPWNVKNIKDYPDYAREQKIGAPPKIWVIKTNQHNAGKIHSTAYSELFSGKVKLLADEKVAKADLLATKKGKKLTLDERIRLLQPYKNTSLFIAETSNLRINKQNVNMKLELIHGGLEKDTFSAFEYGIWTILEEEKKEIAGRAKSQYSANDLLMFN